MLTLPSTTTCSTSSATWPGPCPKTWKTSSNNRSLLLTAVLFCCTAAPPSRAATSIDPALETIAATTRFRQAAISPDGARLAYVESVRGGGARIRVGSERITAAGSNSACNEREVAWSPDSRRIAFLSDCAIHGQFELYTAPAGGGKPHRLTHLKGMPAAPRWSPDGKHIAFLFTEDLPRAAGPLDPVLPPSGVIESKIYEQRIAIVDAAGGPVRQLSPADLYVYDYDWSPDGRTFAATAAHGAGDNNWWIAQLYTIPAGGGEAKSIYKGPRERQLAVPRWTRDGASVLFIGGLMSDEVSTGGDIFQVPAAGGEARNLTPGTALSASDLACPKGSPYIFFTAHQDGGSAVLRLDPASLRVEPLWAGDETILDPFDDASISLSDDAATSAMIRSSWTAPPEVWAGAAGKWTRRTHENSALRPLWGEAKSLHWTSDGFRVQGWLVYPRDFDPAKKYPMVVAVHGGPAASEKPSWPRPGFNPLLLSQQGFFVFWPNPRGSYGQGEKFALANAKDFGGGDLRDILAGVDEAIRTAPIDARRVGITGWSYGGYMTMWAVTQSTRFRAAVAGAGLANWQSYYGQNEIDQWMIPYFGASVYDDPAVYAKSSPINFIKQAKTPTLLVVGGGDGECPPPQSYEFWHALKTLGVKTQLVVYPDEGHSFHKPEDRRDVLLRTIAWFNENLR